jgi:hypothetical protein
MFADQILFREIMSKCIAYDRSTLSARATTRVLRWKRIIQTPDMRSNTAYFIVVYDTESIQNALRSTQNGHLTASMRYNARKREAFCCVKRGRDHES